MMKLYIYIYFIYRHIYIHSVVQSHPTKERAVPHHSVLEELNKSSHHHVYPAIVILGF